MDEFYREINHVKNSFIRTEADELTYCFHIILRYEMEQAIFRDHVPVEELPALWNQKMKEYLQITPKNDRKASCRMYTGRTPPLAISHPICWEAYMTECIWKHSSRSWAQWMNF